MKGTILFILFSLLVGMLSATSYADATEPEVNKTPEQIKIENKFYRQALYYYFAGDYTKALRQISLNKSRFKTLDAKSSLFEAGLQVSIGLQVQATNTLLNFENNQLNFENNQLNFENNQSVSNTQNSKSSTSQKELLLIALLQLAERSIEQGDNKQAQLTLDKITEVSSTYYEQYHTLNQLAYWPEKPINLAKQINDEAQPDNPDDVSAYIQLNDALRFIEQGEYLLAEPILETLKNTPWQPQEETFWQGLFSPFSDDDNSLSSEGLNSAQIQQQGINDYARLLLAQLFIKQGHYEAAFYELKSFPQQGPYTESALFMFAFSAQKTKQYTMSLELLEILYKSYPHSNLGWQSAGLMASQVVEQHTLEEGMAIYQKVEEFYQQRLADLYDFERAFTDTNNLLHFSPANTSLINPLNEQPIHHQLSATKRYETQSIWLQKAMQDAELQTLYGELIELDLLTQHLNEQRLQSQWISDTLTLNRTRKANILLAQEQNDYEQKIQLLVSKRNQIAQQINEAEKQENEQAFAIQSEREWLARIEKSKVLIQALSPHKNTAEYQERLQRVENVLTWQQQQQFIPRLWQHKKQLKTFDKALVIAKAQKQRFADLSHSESSLPVLSKRHQASETKINQLLEYVALLREQTSSDIREKTQQFITQQRDVLQDHLLTSRRSMASVLEQMAKVDRKIEAQLTPESFYENQGEQ